MDDELKDIRERDLVLRTFYTEQRDKHLQQLMAINGQATFAILGISAALLAAIFTGKINTPVKPTWPFIIEVVMVVIAFSLFIGAAISFSFFHTRRIKRFEGLIKTPVEFDQLESDAFQITPRKASNYLVFFGVLTLIIAVFFFLIINSVG